MYLPVNPVTILITTRWHSSMPTHTRIIVGYGGATLCLATILLVTLALATTRRWPAPWQPRGCAAS